MDKKKIRNIAAGAAVVLVLTSPITIGTYMAVNVGFNTPSDYERTATVEYNGESYKLFSLYKLISEDGEEHLCRLDPSHHVQMGVRIKSDGFGFGSHVVKDPGVYVDIENGEELAVEGYEHTGGYKVEKIADLFPFEEYGSKHIVVISQDEFESVVGSGPSMGK